MLKLRMKQTRRGTQDAFHMEEFEAGKEYWIADTLARDFLSRDWAELAAPVGTLPPEGSLALPRKRERTIDPTMQIPQSVLTTRRRDKHITNPATLLALGVDV